MTSSPFILTGYALLLILCILMPYLRPGPRSKRVCENAVMLLLLAGAMFLPLLRQDFPVIALLLLVPLIGTGAASFAGGLVALSLFATVTWWWRGFWLSPGQTFAFLLLAGVTLTLPRLRPLLRPTPADAHVFAPMLTCAGVGLLAGSLTAPFETWDPFNTLWHHWSALLAPVEAWRGGGLPYRDFPIQYGLGPTWLIRASCGSDCWHGLYHVTVVANALYFACLSGGAIILTAGAGRGVRWLAMVALFCATFLWSGFPSQFAGPVITPAVSGLRFGWLAALLFHILLAEHRQVRRDRVGHALWLAALLWSPEAGYFSTALWWPYLALRDASVAGSRVAMWRILAQGTVRAVGALIVGVVILVALLFCLSRSQASLTDFFAYIQHPPGMVPINGYGTLWIAVGVIGIALPQLMQGPVLPSTRPLYACLIAFLAAGIYYLSRSHDNNVLNLFPLMTLLLLSILAHAGRGPQRFETFANAHGLTMLSAMVAFVAAFFWQPWIVGASRSEGHILGAGRMIARLTPRPGDSPGILSPDAARGLAYLRARDGGAVILFDKRMVLPRTPGTLAWTGVNNVANFEILPKPLVMRYIWRGADAYGRSGWIMIGPGYDIWLRMFLTRYDIRAVRRFGAYRAYYLAPRGRPSS